MPKVTLKYMTVSIDMMPDGINLFCSISTVEFWSNERDMFPYNYTYIGGTCTWLIHSNTELTMKMLGAVGETADRICEQGQAINDRRKVANR